MSQLSIRSATLADAPAVAELFDAYRQFYEQPADSGLALRFIGERLRRGDAEILLAFDDQRPEPLGFCQLYPSFCSVEAAPIYVLYDLFVLPEARRLSVGRALLIAAEQLAARQGKVRMDLTTARTNLQAQRLYQSLGWVRDDVFLAYNRRIGS